MTDLAKCAGRDCPQRDDCLRYTAPPNDRPLSSFDADRNGGACDGYWPLRPSTQHHNGSNQ